MRVDQEQESRSLQSILEIDLNLRREELKDALLNYEDTHPGNNLVGSKVYEFLRHCQNIVWKQLADLALTRPEEYFAWKNGECGHWPLETNNVAHGVLLRLSECRRAKLQEYGEPIDRTKSGMPVVTDNIRRTVLNWRRKTTANWVTQTGDTLSGFPFFFSWTRLNRAGIPDPKGRGNVIGLVNLTWIFGPEWADKSGENAPDLGAVSEDYPEKISTIPPILKTVEKKKNEGEWFSAKAEDEKGSAKTPIEPGIKTAHQQGTLPPASEQENEQINIAPGPAAGGGVLARATALWQVLLLRIFTPHLGSGRVRHSGKHPYTGACFNTYTIERCIKLLAENLHSARNAGDATLEEAEIRLRNAIELQAKYMDENPEAWVLSPEKFLRLDPPNGTLLSALRIFVREETTRSCIPPQIPENESDQERKNRLYNRLLTLGAHRIHPGTFSKWYKQFGLAHVEACLIYMTQQAARRRETGKALKREFDSNQGGASAYFASLITRFDSKGVQRESEIAGRHKIKNNLWEAVFDIRAGKMSPELDKLRDEMAGIYFRMCQEPDFRDAAIHDTNEFFQMSINNFNDPTNIVLVHYVLNQQN